MSLQSIAKQFQNLIKTEQNIETKLFFIFLCCFIFTYIRFSFAAEPVQPLEPADIAYYFPSDKSIIQTVRIALLEGVREGTLSFDASFNIKTIETQDSLGTFHVHGRNRVVPTKVGFRLGNEQFKIYGALIHPTDDKFTLNGVQYRGDLIVIRGKDMTLLFINYVNIEDYLRGVLPVEVSPHWSPEALKAQAVVSRTYAVFSEVSSLYADYSMKKTVASQLYGGMRAENDVTDKAINDTKGEVLTYKETIFPGYFHANCGGHTTRPDTVWYVKPHPVLRGVASPYCKDTKHYSWSLGISSEGIEEALISRGFAVGSVYDIRAKEKDDSGRITSFEIITSKGTVDIKGNDFRLALGPEKLRSTKIETIIRDRNSFIFEGFGWGHGVGFCQWGAKVMADEGYTYNEILKHYFPSSKKGNIIY